MTTVLVLGTADWNQPIATNQHYMVRELSRTNDVIFVESIGLRQPALKLRDLKRMARRLRKNREATAGDRRPVPDGVKILSPKVIPRHKGIATVVNSYLLKRQVRCWIESAEPKALWLYTPVNYGLTGFAQATIYHCVDLLGEVPGIDPQVISRAERKLAHESVTAIASSEVVANHLKNLDFRKVHYWRNVADTAVFDWTQREHVGQRHPAAVFAGNLSTSKVDFSLLQSLVRAGVQLHLAGPIAEGGGSADLDVTRLISQGATYHGILNLPELAELYTKCKVGLIPYLRNEYTEGVSPLKTFEYLAAGLGVVSTDLPGVDSHPAGVVTTSSDADFVSAVKQLISDFDSEKARVRLVAARSSSWIDRGEDSRALLELELKSQTLPGAATNGSNDAGVNE